MFIENEIIHLFNSVGAKCEIRRDKHSAPTGLKNWGYFRCYKHIVPTVLKSLFYIRKITKLTPMVERKRNPTLFLRGLDMVLHCDCCKSSSTLSPFLPKFIQPLFEFTIYATYPIFPEYPEYKFEIEFFVYLFNALPFIMRICN